MSESPREDAGGSALPPRAAAATDPGEADLERRIVEAELRGRTTVADLLARELETLRAKRAAKVVDLQSRRREKK